MCLSLQGNEREREEQKGKRYEKMTKAYTKGSRTVPNGVPSAFPFSVSKKNSPANILERNQKGHTEQSEVLDS
jgi:hypothetical protein